MNVENECSRFKGAVLDGESDRRYKQRITSLRPIAVFY